MAIYTHFIERKHGMMDDFEQLMQMS